jgi:K+-sensing histidine kinase KdpD
MAHRDRLSPTPMPTILRYGIAVLSVAIAIGLGFLVLRHFEAILTPFLFAVAATVWYAETRPDVLAIVLSVLSLNYFFLRPEFSFSPISLAMLISFIWPFAYFAPWLSAGSAPCDDGQSKSFVRPARSSRPKWWNEPPT